MSRGQKRHIGSSRLQTPRRAKTSAAPPAPAALSGGTQAAPRLLYQPLVRNKQLSSVSELILPIPCFATPRVSYLSQAWLQAWVGRQRATSGIECPLVSRVISRRRRMRHSLEGRLVGQQTFFSQIPDHGARSHAGV